MHWQARNPFRERDRAISLMPMARPDGEPSIAFGTFIIGLPFVLAVAAIVAFGG